MSWRYSLLQETSVRFPDGAPLPARHPQAAPADPGTGALVRVNDDGTLTTVVGGLDRPTSLEMIRNTAYVVTIAGEVWAIDDVAAPPFGNTQR